MGFFKKIKENIQNIIQRRSIKRLGTGEYCENQYYNNIDQSQNLEQYKEIEYLRDPYIRAIPGTDEYVRIGSIKFENQIIHSNGIATNLMVAKVIRERNGKTFNEDNQDYVVFEMPCGINIDDIILQKIVDYYLFEKNMLNSEKCVYIGRVNNNPQDYNINKSNYVDQYVKKQIRENIINEMESKKLNKERSFEILRKNTDISCKKYRENLQNGTRQYLQNEEKVRNERIKNFYLRRKLEYRGKDERVYQEYDGVNISNGEILKLRQLNKVGKDEETGRTYLYTGYIQSTGHDYDVELISKDKSPSGMIPVCFTLDKKIDEIIKQNNQREIYSVLSLLSNKENYENNNGFLNYIGSIDIDGNIFKSQDRLPQSIRENIKNLQQQFYQRKIDEKNKDGQYK